MATFSSLPLELKRVIVRQVHDQDEHYKEVNETDGPRKDNWKLAPSVFNGKSLNALFLVNKELSDLAAVHLFHSVNAVKCLSKDWRYEIMAKRGRHVRHLDLLPADGGDEAEILSTCAEQSTCGMPNIESIFCASAFQSYWRSDDYSDPDDLRGFAILTSRVLRATLANFHSDDVKKFLDIAPRITSIVTYAFFKIDEVQELVEAHPRLQHIGLGGGIAPVDPDLFEYTFSKTVALKSLSFDLSDCDEDDLTGAIQLAASCGSFLESLEINITSLSSRLTDWTAPEISIVGMFANLDKLTLTGTPADTLKILHIFSSAPPKAIDLRFTGHEPRLPAQIPPNIFPSSAQLLVLRENANVGLKRAGRLHSLFRTAGSERRVVRHMFISKALSVTTWRGTWDSPELQCDVLAENVEELSTFATASANWYRTIGDSATLGRLMKSLEPLIAFRDLVSV